MYWLDPENLGDIGFCVDKCPSQKNLDYCFYDTDGKTILIDYCYKTYASTEYLNKYCVPWDDNVRLPII